MSAAADTPARAVAVPRRRRRRARRIFALLGLLLGLGLAVVLVEVGLRLFAPIGLGHDRDSVQYFSTAIDFAWQGLPAAQPPALPAGLDLEGRLFQHKPAYDGVIGSFRVRTNAFGCRGPAVAAAKPLDVFRILLLGDSVAFGWGVDDEVTFARRLEQEWNAAAPARRLEVLNSGIPKYDSNQADATLRVLGPQLQPDLVLLVYVVNDIEPTRDLVEGLLTGRAPHPEEQVAIPDDAWSWLSARLHPWLPATAALLNLRTDLEARVQRILPPGQRYRPEEFGAGPRGWPRSQAALLRMQQWCREAGVPFVLFDHTLPRIESLQPFCREHGIDHEPFWFSPEDLAQGVTISWIDSHANARGHELLLRRLQAALQRRGLLPRG